MDTDRLREFVTVAQMRSFTESAAKLHLSQSVVSRHISALEQEVGEQLFVRDCTRVDLTLAGRVFLEGARKVILAAEEFESSIRTFKKSPRHALSVELFVGYKPTDDLMSALDAEFARSSFFTEVNLIDITNQDALQDVRDGTCDLAIIGSSLDVGSPDLACIPVIAEPFVAVVGKEHFFTNRQTLSPSDLDSMVVWEREGPRYLYQHLRRYLEKLDVHPDYRMHTWENVGRMYAEIPFDSAGITLTFASVARHSMPAIQSGCTVLSFDDPGFLAPVNALYNPQNPNPACHEAAARIERIVTQTDMSVFWR